MNLEQLQDACTQLVRALAALHSAHIVQRDIKPSKVRVTPEGRVMLMDFGIVTEWQQHLHAQRYESAGTPAFMAPEQMAAGQVFPAIEALEIVGFRSAHARAGGWADLQRV